MIMEMTLFVNIIKRSGNKKRRNDNLLFKRRDTVKNNRDLILILLQFKNFYFIPAATVGGMSSHPAPPAYLCFYFEQMG